MKHIVIIGGGYGGVSVLRRLANTKDIHITLIDRHPYHFLQTEGYELVANTLPFDKTIVNLHTLSKSFGEHVTFIHDGVKKIDITQRCIQCDKVMPLFYDYLILSVGSVTRFVNAIKGLKSCSRGVKSMTGAFEMKQFFEKELYLRLENAQQAKQHYSILVAGAGLSGVEIAAQMQEYFNRYYKSNTLACNTLKIHLVSGSKTILKHMHPKTSSCAYKRLEKLGVILHTGAHITKIKTDIAYLENKQNITFDFMIFTGGIMGSPLLNTLGLSCNKLGQIKVLNTLQIPEYPNIFAIGDAAEIVDKKGKILPDNAQVAIKSGICAANNIKQLLKNKQPLVANIKLKGVAIALGGRYAILDMEKIRIYGIVAYYLKKIVEKFYKWPLWLRCKAGYEKTTSCQI